MKKRKRKERKERREENKSNRMTKGNANFVDYNGAMIIET